MQDTTYTCIRYLSCVYLRCFVCCVQLWNTDKTKRSEMTTNKRNFSFQTGFSVLFCTLVVRMNRAGMSSLTVVFSLSLRLECLCALKLCWKRFSAPSFFGFKFVVKVMASSSEDAVPPVLSSLSPSDVEPWGDLLLLAGIMPNMQ